jgi:hypothetical protein
MFTLDAASSLGMCTIFDEDDTKRTTGGLVYLGLENEDLAVRGKEPSDLLLWCQWGDVGDQDRSRRWGTSGIFAILQDAKSIVSAIGYKTHHAPHT